MQRQWKRRDILRTAGVASLVAPVASLWTDLSEAQPGEKKNLVLFYMPNGKTKSNSYVTKEGGSWKFGPGFAPFEKYRQDLIAFENYAYDELNSNEYNGDHQGHVSAGMLMFTGDVAYDDNGAGRGGRQPSLDQIVAWDYLQRGVISNPLRKSLNIKIEGSSFRSPTVYTQTPSDYALNKAYTDQRKPVVQLEKPTEGFAQMFEGIGGSESVQELWAFGKSILDVPTAELNGLQPLLPMEGQQVLEDHLQSLRELEVALANDGALENGQLQAPGEVETTADNHVEVLSQWFDIIDAALRFDRTRIVALQAGGIASRFQIPELKLGEVGNGDSNSGNDFHSYTHWQEPEVDLFLQWFSARMVELLDRMKGGPEREDILKDSAVLFGTEFGNNHKPVDMPVTLFGQAGGYFQTGRLIDYGSQSHKHTGTLLAVAHAMGTTGLTQLGNPKGQYQQGPAEEMRG